MDYQPESTSSYINDNEADCLLTRIESLYTKYKRTQDLQDLEEAVETTREIVEITTSGRFHARFLDILGTLILDRFQRTGADTDLEDAIRNATQVMEITPRRDIMRPMLLNNLAVKLRQRSYATYEVGDVEMGIELCKEGLDHPFKFEPCRQALLSTLGSSFGILYRTQLNVKDLEEAIKASNESLTLEGFTPDSKAAEYNNLGNRLANLYDETGNPDHLKEAIQHAREALRCTADENYRPSRLANLGKKLIHQYQRTMSLDNLNDAVECLRQAVTSPLYTNNDDWPGIAEGFAKGLMLRYERTGNDCDLDESLRFQQHAIDHEIIHANHPSRPSLVGNLGTLSYASYQEEDEIERLMNVIKTFEDAVELGKTTGTGDRPAQLQRRYNLGAARYQMYLRTGSQSSDLLQQAYWDINSASSEMQDDNPSKATFLFTFGLICQTLGDIYEALACFDQAFTSSCSLPIIRVWAARSALRIHENTKSWDEAILLAGSASKLLPLVCSRYISLRDQQHAIAQVSGLAADAASLFLMAERPDEALQQLEFSRGLILSYLVDSNSNLSNMKQDSEACALAERYENLRNELNQAPRDENLSGRQDQLLSEIEACAEDIRNLTKYKRFLLGPEIEDLTSAVPSYPIVVVNTTNIASHAIITWEGKVTSLPLQQSPIEGAPTRVRNLFARYGHVARGDFHTDNGRVIYAVDDDIDGDDFFLSWLWNSCVRLVLNKLESLGLPLDGQHRVWWIGTGIASSFPFHAASLHSSQTSECTLMKVISSYATSIKTLTFSMNQNFEKTHIEGPKRLLFVGMPTTPGGHRPLPGVLEEESVIRKAEILDRITESDVVHFACHGSSNPALPSKSHLLLQNQDESGLVVDQLTVEDLSKVKAKDRCFIAFLSACSTAAVKPSCDLADEAIHLASNLQAVGFARTIGTLWPAFDKAFMQVSKEFYTILFDNGKGELSDEKVARALHSAICTLRSTAKSRDTWMPFIHYGG
ncbi:chat domain-containing [Fusarium longipes]|uniref:Chat domain-containing n=1 Tax=Fusarium longipes TaxID=694270 RepID=A0A395SFQ8_9HYPO|nr:chat domain-containing [Fusarium longipes]